MSVYIIIRVMPRYLLISPLNSDRDIQLWISIAMPIYILFFYVTNFIEINHRGLFSTIPFSLLFGKLKFRVLGI